MANEGDHEEPQQSEFQDDWMLLCQQNPLFSVNMDENPDFDWEADAHDLPPDLLRSAPTWITSQRHLYESSSNSPWQRQLPQVDIQTLNLKQTRAYEFIRDHYAQLSSGTTVDPIRMIVSGTAGSGKSYLISAIANALGEACILTGTTGMASFNICGRTIHSVLHLPIHNTQQELKGATLQKFQRALNGKHYLIIDEMSMIGHRMLAWIDRRLKQASGKLDTILGGFSVILFGDFGQLPPVSDRPLYATPKQNQLCTDGYHVYLTFNTVVILDQVLRQSGRSPEDEQFRTLLLRLRNGNVTQEDWKLLKQRDPSKVDCSEFADAIRLFYDKQSVAEYNLIKLHSLGNPIAQVQGIHSSATAAHAKSDDAGGLFPIAFLAVNSRVMLTANL